MSIYVEIEIRAPVDEVWEKTQVPHLHQQWDLRFSRIEYLPRENESSPQRFLYATRIGFGLDIEGEGETVGNRNGGDGSRTSALKFWSDDFKSLIREGSGYWKCIPSDSGVTFLTWYRYSTRFGVVGSAFDAMIFQPLIGWATAWSFDRLRLWIEKGIDPAASLRSSIVYATARIVVAFVWIYHGVVPKLIFQRPEEMEMLAAVGFAPGELPTILAVIGWLEVLFSLHFLVAWRSRFLFLLNILLMICTLAAVAIDSPGYLSAPFNPVTLNIVTAALSLVGYLAGKEIPTAARCRRKMPEEKS